MTHSLLEGGVAGSDFHYVANSDEAGQPLDGSCGPIMMMPR